MEPMHWTGRRTANLILSSLSIEEAPETALGLTFNFWEIIEAREAEWPAGNAIRRYGGDER